MKKAKLNGTINITFWNLHGLGNIKGCSLINSSDILATCETWCTCPPSTPPTTLSNYNTFWANAVREHAIGRASGGLLTAISKKYTSTVLDITPWWIFNLIIAGSTTLIIGSVYFRKCLNLNYLLDLFQDTIDEIKTAHTYDAFILGGDSNAKVGSMNPWPEELFLDSALQNSMSSSDKSICDRGRRLMDFMLENDFVLLNGRTQSDVPAQPTFDGAGTSIIDLVWIDLPALHHVVDLEVVLEPTLSDHRPVNLKIAVDIAVDVENVKACNTRKPLTPSLRIKWSDNAKDDYSYHLANCISPISSNDLDSQYNSIHSAIFTAADKANLVMRRSNSGQSFSNEDSPWYDLECKLAKREYRKSLKIYKKENHSQPARTEAAKYKKIYRDICKVKQKEYNKQINDAFNAVSMPTNFWAAIRKLTYKTGLRSSIPIDSWNDFYSKVYSLRHIAPPILVRIFNDTLDSEITYIELNAVLSSLKVGKAAGPDLLPNEVYKSLTPHWKENLRCLYNNIVTFKAAGRHKECPEQFRRYKGTSLNIVKTYSYLGVKISSTTMGLSALKSATNKAKCATGATVALLARAKCDSLKVFTKLFDTMVASVFLYAFPAWGLWYRNSLESVQTQFYKRIYNLPRNTPDWVLHLEFGLTPVAWKAMHMLWNWTIKTLKNNESLFSKICLVRLFQLAKSSPQTQPFNWATQFREFLIECDCVELMESLDPCLWEDKTNSIFTKYRNILLNKDIESARISKSLEFGIQRPLQLAPAKYVVVKTSLTVKRIFAQLRLANKLYCQLIINNQIIRFTPNTSCQLCNLHDLDNIEHFLLKCPLFSALRNYHLGCFLGTDVPLSSLLNTTDIKTILAIVNFTEKSAQLRAWALNQ
ncbi:Protein of unknown function [Cotesia congregata]|uniref:Endonuclease/exonuclease/phosphatase domain-containing protein n=1 Tax=Cotesia congregata TaxID=51543 RepID=A0A8J2HGK1_COTCN|nr:Protein of unknown function [Cotesia congregata]